ncbi:MAG: serine/threonine-protein kinase [Phycisphaerales bacterium]
MSDADLSQLRALFDEVCDLPPQQRGRVLDGRGLSPNLRRELDKLLASHDSVGEFMEKPAGHVPADLQDDFGRVMSERDAKGSRLAGTSREHDPLIGFSLGGYRVTRVLGEGGMGVVYEAQQEQPSRTVALKVMRWSLPSERLRKRFQHEAQALGRLQHPGIAQIFEAGSAPGPDGRSLPFFAMEFVAGTPLLEYAKEQSLDLRAKAELMAMVAEAVQHAHQKGVIHRDLKPANILVENEVTRTGTKLSGASATHGGARPRVLDFGIARLTEPQSEATAGTGESGIASASAPSLVTDTGQLLGTVAYMSPEQARGDASAIDTRSDVYAMGVVLYELLTGQLPYDVRNKPITQAAAVIASAEATFDRERDNAIASELQTIVLKALEKEPERRYASAGDLAADLRRHLEDLPISARPPTTLYHVRKFAKRNRTLVAGVAAAFLMLVLGVVGTTIGLLRAKEAQKLAETRLTEAKVAAKTAESSEAFLMSILTAANPVVAKNRELTVRELLDEAAKKLDSASTSELATENAVALRSRLALAKTYLSIAAYDQSVEQANKADQFAIEHFGKDSVEHSLVMAQQCEYFQSRSMISDGLPLAEHCLEVRLAQLPADDVLIGRAEYALGRLLATSAKFSESIEHLRKAAAIAELYGGTDPILYATELASVLRRTRSSSDREEAIRILESNLERARSLGGQGYLLASHVLMNLSEISSIRNEYPKMVEQLTEAVQLRESVYPKDHPHVLFAKSNLARAKRVAGDYAGSRAEADAIIEPTKRVMGKDAGLLRDIYEDYARCCIDQKDYDCAKEKALAAVGILNDKSPFIYKITTMTTLVEVCLYRKDWQEVVDVCDKMLALAKERNVSAITMHVTYTYRIRGLMGLGRLDEALAGVNEILNGLPDVAETLDARLETRVLKAEALSAMKKYEESHALFEDIINELETKDPTWASEVLETLAASLDTAGNKSKADEARKRAADLSKIAPATK